jgi:hypothetical protein
MALGFCFGYFFDWETRDRSQAFLLIGVVLITAFACLRGFNLYGDPRPWQHGLGFIRSALSYLNVTKYPPSLLFCLLTLGLSILLLRVIEHSGKSPVTEQILRVLKVFGRVPLFYFLFHAALAHAIALVAAGVTNRDWRWFLSEPPAGGVWGGLPKEWGFGLPTVWVLWVLVVAISYPVCRWYARVKERSRNPLLSFL